MPSKHDSDSTSEYSSDSTSEYSSDSICPHEVQVLRVPAKSSNLEIFTVDTIIYDRTECKNIDARTINLERILGHTPDLRLFNRSGMIDLGYLCLFDRNSSGTGSSDQQPWRGIDGVYYIYKCVTETPAKLPANRNLKKFDNGRGYGDAFVFKVLSVDKFHGKDKAVFGSMHGLLRHLKEGDKRILERLARW